MVRILAADAPGAIDDAVELLRRGELVGIPTETVYGICALPAHTSVERLIAAKQRSTEKGIQLLVDSIDQVRSLAVVTRAAEQLAERFWPGAMTVVLERRSDIDLTALLGGARTTLGLRLPDHVVPRALARRLGPIAASSANVSGEPDATTATLVERSLGAELDSSSTTARSAAARHRRWSIAPTQRCRRASCARGRYLPRTSRRPCAEG